MPELNQINYMNKIVNKIHEDVSLLYKLSNYGEVFRKEERGGRRKVYRFFFKRLASWAIQKSWAARWSPLHNPT